jgi:hypothetical protein
VEFVSVLRLVKAEALRVTEVIRLRAEGDQAANDLPGAVVVDVRIVTRWPSFRASTQAARAIMVLPHSGSPKTTLTFSA